MEIDSRLGSWRLGGYAEGYAIIKTDSDSTRQRPAGILFTEIDGDVGTWLAAHLDMTTVFGGAPENATGIDVYNLRDTFQNVSPSIDFGEAYVTVYLPSLDIRIGKQKFSWGVLDGVQPTDVLNPRDYTDLFLADELDEKIGVPSLRTSFSPRFMPSVDLALVWIPIPVANRFPTETQRWFPSSFEPSSVASIGEIELDTTLVTKNASPRRHLEDGAVGARAGGLFRGIDWSTYFYYGGETRPAFDLTVTAEIFNPELVQVVATLSPRFRRIWLLGGDFSLAAGDFTVRGEVAYSSGRLLPRSVSDLVQSVDIPPTIPPDGPISVDLGDLFVVRDIIQWGLGIDYVWQGWTSVAQVSQTAVFDNGLSLLQPNVDTGLLAALQRSFFADRLTLEASVLQTLERSSTVAILRATYEITDHLRARAGYLAIGGSRNSLIGQFKQNDELFFQLRYSV